jgi:hypothetical protein
MAKTHLNCPCGEAITGADEDELVEKTLHGLLGATCAETPFPVVNSAR